MVLKCYFVFILLSGSIISEGQNSSPKDDTVEFSNFRWNKKVQSSKVGPGPNYFGLHKKNVFVDRNGNLHLSLKKKKGTWSCAEVSTDSILKEGIYEITFYCMSNTMPDNAVLGLFLYDEKNPPSHNEVDFELSIWNKSNEYNAQHVVYNEFDYTLNRFDLPQIKEETKHMFKVDADSIRISSYSYKSDSLLFDSTFKRPESFDFKQTKFRINLWLSGLPKEEQKSFEVVITSFDYTEL